MIDAVRVGFATFWMVAGVALMIVAVEDTLPRSWARRRALLYTVAFFALALVFAMRILP